MNRLVYLAVALSVLAGTVSAGTVVLSGSCTAGILTNSINFTVVNSGNETATNLVLTPYFHGANISSMFYTAPAIGENATVNFDINFSGVAVPGTYSGYFILAYQQGGGQGFAALFPCLISVRNQTYSQVLANAGVVDEGSTQEVNVSMFNEGAQVQDVNVSLMIPPAIVQDSQSNYSLTLEPFVQKNINFSVKTPPAGTSYSAAVSVQYVYGGMHYSTLSVFVISGHSSATGGSIYSYLPFALIVVVILIVLALIARRIAHKGNVKAATKG